MFRIALRSRVLQLALLLPAVLLASAAPAMAQAASASISGTITDSQGGVLPGVTLTVTNAESGTVRTSVTEADGKFRVAGLNPGRYNVTADLPGFQSVAVKDVTLQVGQDYTRDFQLALSTLQESVTVTGEAPIIEATKTEVSTVITQQQIESLPMQDRTQQPELPGSVSGTRSGQLRLDRAAEHQHPQQRARKRAGQYLHAGLLAATDGRYGD